VRSKIAENTVFEDEFAISDSAIAESGMSWFLLLSEPQYTHNLSFFLNHSAVSFNPSSIVKGGFHPSSRRIFEV